MTNKKKRRPIQAPEANQVLGPVPQPTSPSWGWRLTYAAGGVLAAIASLIVVVQFGTDYFAVQDSAKVTLLNCNLTDSFEFSVQNEGTRPFSITKVQPMVWARDPVQLSEARSWRLMPFDAAQQAVGKNFQAVMLQPHESKIVTLPKWTHLLDVARDKTHGQWEDGGMFETSFGVRISTSRGEGLFGDATFPVMNVAVNFGAAPDGSGLSYTCGGHYQFVGTLEEAPSYPPKRP